MTTVNLEPTISSIPQLQGTCNTIEKRIFEKLIKLEAVLDVDGNKKTEATFNGGTMDELGTRKITAGGTHSAFIESKNTAVSIA